MHSFMKISSRNVKISLALTDLCNSCPSREFEAWQMSFKAIRENKVLAKSSEIYSTVYKSEEAYFS